MMRFGLFSMLRVSWLSCRIEGHREVAGSMGLEDPEAQVKRVRVFKHMFEVSKLMLIPIRGLSPEHFSLLALSKSDKTEV